MTWLFISVSVVTKKSGLMNKELIFRGNICPPNSACLVIPKGKLNESNNFNPVMIDFGCVYL